MYMKKRILSVMLALSLVVSLLPSMPVYAEKSTDDISWEEMDTVPATDEAVEETDEISEETDEVSEAASEETEEGSESGAEQEAVAQTASEEVGEVEADKQGKSVLKDSSAKVAGSNGILYSDVAYLSAAAIAHLSDDAMDAYTAMCDEISSWKENGEDIRDIVISVDKEGGLALSYFVPFQQLTESQENLLNTEEVLSLSDYESEEGISGNAESESAEMMQDEESENDEESDESASEAEAEEDNETETGKEDETGTDSETEAVTEESSETETDTEETTEEVEEKEETAAPEEETVIEENVALAQSYEIPEETIIGSDAEQFDTLFWKNTDHFYNQLSSTEKAFYDAGYKKMVKGSSNGFSVTYSYVSDASSVICNAISALINTYPQKFDWMNRGTGGWRASYRYSKGKFTYKITLVKSKHYSSSLESSAKKKVTKLVQEANTYASAYYPNSPTYGIIRYLDKWICENNYYNYTGTSPEESVRSGNIYYYCHSSYGILLKGYGVCESYALAMSRLLDAAGIPNLYVVGDAGGGHAWNYVQMPNGSWYMVDSTWNDNGATSSGNYLLCKDDGVHKPTGKGFGGGKNFTFVTLASANYSVAGESVSLSDSTVVLKPKETRKLAITNTTYYDKFGKVWSSSNAKVAKVDKNGKVTAVAPGKAVITLSIAGKQTSCTVYVYQFTGLNFTANSKSSYTYNYQNADTVFNTSDMVTLTITAVQKNKQISASNICSSTGLAYPTATSSSTKVAEISSCTLSGDNITLRVKAVGVGTSTIKVKFGGKTATLTYKVTQKLQNAWFSALPYTSVDYTGSTFSPKVTLTASAPKGLKYSVKYKNNKNAGTASVVMTGTGNYSGEISRTFTIRPSNITTATVSAIKSKVYTGKVNKPSFSVTLNKKTLKAGTDYDVTYVLNGSSTSSPQNKGVYTVRITGKGNYTGTISNKTYEITAASLSKVTVSCPSTVKYTGNYVYPSVKVKLGSVVLTTADYSITYYDAQGNQVTPRNKGKYTVEIKPRGNVTATATKTSIKKSFTIK